jgi:hypothetical protein
MQAHKSPAASSTALALPDAKAPEKGPQLALTYVSLRARTECRGAGVAEQRQAPLKDLLFANPKLLEMVGRNLPARPGLLAELGDLLDLGRRALAQALLPHALPALVAVDNREGLEALAKQVRSRPTLGSCSRLGSSQNAAVVAAWGSVTVRTFLRLRSRV